IGTLFAFVLVCGGVLFLPKLTSTTNKFRIPYINGRWIVTALTAVFIFFSKQRIIDAVNNIGSENQQEVLFLIFIVA
ncbi:hypothetical protein ABTK02_23050, partial [Acinetobacter baumannii]